MNVKEICKIIPKTATLLPFFEVGIAAGFPSPADDYLERQLDLHELLVEHPAATFFVRVEGDSMIEAGLQSGDILIVDRSLKPRNGKIVVALLNGEFTVKRLKIEDQKLYLLPENPRYQPIEVAEDSDFQVWGVVTYVIHRSG
ncbi:MAG: translesion error-prone DNA polymerase V autoproteolytic subunit [Chlamydiales bacterium]